MMFQRAMPVLQVSDVEASAAFYERLGFRCHGAWRHQDVAQFAILQRGPVTLAVQHDRGATRPRSGLAAYIYVDDVAALHTEFSELGADVGAIRTGNEYGCDDFDLIDPDGYTLAFGQDLKPIHGPGLAAVPVEA